MVNGSSFSDSKALAALFGRSTSTPTVNIGAATIKMIKRTNITSTKGVTFISDIGTDLRLCLLLDCLVIFKLVVAPILTIQLTAQDC